jgi:hypothetical protein
MRYVKDSHPTLRTEHLSENARLFATREDMLSSFDLGPAPKLAEVGVALGNFSEFMIKKYNPSKFVAIDIFKMHEIDIHWGVPKEQTLGGLKHLDFYKNRFANYAHIMEYKAGESYDGIADTPNNFFDLIYLDADHSYSYIKKDAEVSALKLKQDGILVFNDYIMYDHCGGVEYGVVQVVNEMVVYDNWEIIGFSLQRGMFCDIAIKRK